MKAFITLGLWLALAGTAAATPPPADESVFVEGTRYGAVLDADNHRWRLLPVQGRDVRLQVAEHCREGQAPPQGLWLLSRDAFGRATLVAPSATPLPPGHPGQVWLVPCGTRLPAGTPALSLPASLIDWLDQHGHAVYVRS